MATAPTPTSHHPHRTWQQELEIIDRTMKAISGITDPEEMVDAYWNGIGELLPFENYLSVSRRQCEPPHYLVTRSSRAPELPNPWLYRDRLPLLSGGVAGEIVYANKPVIIDNLPAALSRDDPAWFYLQGFESLIALPQYDQGEGLNVTMLLLPPGGRIDQARIPMLHWHGGLFGRGTQNLVLRNQLASALEALDAELQTVGEIQRSLLPSQLPQITGYDLCDFYQTSARAGGDYYDFFPLDNGRWGIFIADVSGHGTPAAVLMAIIRTLAHALPDAHGCPVDFLQELNTRLFRSYGTSGAFVTAFYGVLNPASGELTYSLAGHNPPRLVRRGSIIELGENGELPLGILESQTYRQARATLVPGDMLLLYTDGITETMAPARSVSGGPASRELFGLARLDAALTACPDFSAQECLHTIREHITAHARNAPQADDQTMLAIRYRG